MQFLVENLFNLFALLYVFRGVQLMVQIRGEWSLLRSEPLARAKKLLADQAAYFIAVPLSVALHEFCHVLATWGFGGQIGRWHYAAYWGYVEPLGNFTPSQQWFIAIAGTLGNIFYGILLWFVLRRHSSSSFCYFALRAFRFQLHFALVYYPVFTIFVPAISDWRFIYNFNVTPVLSGLTAVAHAISLYFFYMAERRGWFEMAGFETAAEQERFTKLKEQWALNPHDRQLAMRYIDGLWRGGAARQAQTHLALYLQQYPDDAGGYALLAGFQAGNNSHVPAQSKAYAQKALDLGVTDPHLKALAYRILGEYALERHHYPEASSHLSQAIATLTGALHKGQPQPGEQRSLAELYSRRSLVYRRQNNFDLAYQDGEQALQLAQTAGDNGRAQHYAQELAIIQQHAGRPLGTSHNAPSSQDVV